MTWWLRSRIVPAVAVALALSLAVVATLPKVVVVLPTLAGGPGLPSPVSYLAPLAPTLAVCAGLARRNPQLERGTTRHLWAWDVALVLACVVAHGIVALALGTDAALGAARTMLGDAGIVLLGAATASPAASAAVAVGWAALASMGGLPLGSPIIWTWPALEPVQTGSWVCAGVLLGAGVGLCVARR